METPEHRDFVSSWDRVSQTKAIPDNSAQDTFTPRKVTHSWISLSERNFCGVGQYSWRPRGPRPAPRSRSPRGAEPQAGVHGGPVSPPAALGRTGQAP